MKVAKYVALALSVTIISDFLLSGQVSIALAKLSDSS